MTRLTREQAADYWEGRHRTSDQWRAGGDRGLDEKQNEAFYYVRYGLLLRLLVGHFGPDRRLRVLDAGCGRGWLTSHLVALGHEAMGVDTSEAAIRHARESCSAPFHVASLDEFSTTQRFDAVVSMDVLYHITDDDQWRWSLRNLSELLDDRGVLVFSDILGPETSLLGDYVLHRSRAEYERVLAELGLSIAVSDPYQVFSPAAWHLCVRSGARV